MTNQEIANLISLRIGPEPVPFESVRALCLEIYQDLGGTEDDEHFEDIYQLLLAIVPLAQGGGGGGGGVPIDDHDVSTRTAWSSSRIMFELENYALNSSLDDYATKNYVDSSLALKQDTLIAGDNITIQNNVISATGGGSLDPSNYYNKTQVDNKLALKADKTQLYSYATIANVNSSLATKQDTLIPGENITIVNNVISATGGGQPVDPSNYYTKSLVDDKLALKADEAELANYATLNDVSAFITEADLPDLSGYATIANVDASLALKADKTYVDSSLDLKANKTELNSYATIVNVDSSLALKADKTYVDSSLDNKVNTSEMVNYATKNDISTFITAEDLPDLSGYATIANVDASLALKADKTYVDASLNNKVNTSEMVNYATIANVDASLALKANASDLSNYATIANVDSSLSLKADKTYVDASLDNKVNTSEMVNYATKNDISTFLVPNDVSIYATIANVDSSLAIKADKTYVDASLNNKVNTSEMVNYATKNDISTFIDATALNGYATEQFVNSSLSNYATIANVDSSLSLKADKTYVDASLNNKANTSDLASYATITNVDASLALKADKTELTDFVKFEELTQAQYDLLQTKDPSTLYVITDAPAFVASHYYTKSEIDAMIGDISTALANILGN